MANVKVWEDYYQHFGLSPNDIRSGCEPRIIINDDSKKDVIVLIHGLTDSPYYVEAIGQYFHNEMGFNVFMPLLDGHGLKKPKGMKNVNLQTWIENVDFAIDAAQAISDETTVHVGGFSTGGALSVHRSLFREDDINGHVYLYSAALDLAGERGDLNEILLRIGLIKEIVAINEDKSFLEWIQDILFWLGLAKERGKSNPLVGDNPYRYIRMDKDGAAQLSFLIKALDDELKDATLKQPVFVAHSEDDQTADIEGVEKLVAHHPTHEFFRIDKQLHIGHSRVPLRDDVRSLSDPNTILEIKNPVFQEMMEAARQFTLRLQAS